MKLGLLALVSCLLVAEAGLAQSIVYRPGFYRLAIEAAFMGRIRIESATIASCGIVHEATVVETIAGAAPGGRVRFVASVEPGRWAAGSEHFAMLFAHALPGAEPGAKCWVEAAPLYAASAPASVVPFDRRAGELLGGEFLPAAPGTVLEGLRFSAIELWLDGKGQHLASWELVRAFARQTPAAQKAWPTLPDDVLGKPPAGAP